MSRWQVEFEQHPFQPIWKALVDEVSTLTVDDITVVTAVEELARLKRVVEFLRVILEAMDAELTPKSVWDTFLPQLSACLQQVRHYVGNRNMVHLNAANDHADNLLSYVRPYMVQPEKVLEGLQGAAKSHRLFLETSVSAFGAEVSETAKQIRSDADEAAQMLHAQQTLQVELEALRRELLEDTPEQLSTRAQIQQLKSIVDEQVAAVLAYSDKLLKDGQEGGSIRQQIAEAEQTIASCRAQMVQLLENTEQRIQALDAFHAKIFGLPDGTGANSVGLKEELTTRLTQLAAYEADQRSKHQALAHQIEALLPGATSASLASAYRKIKLGFTWPVWGYTLVFFVATVSLLLLACATTVESFSFWPWNLTLVSTPRWEDALRMMLVKLPLVAPLVWMAVFAANRRGQYERLRQEYAHKEALASSYESYKKQLQALISMDTEPLQKELIAKAIDAIAYNASVTLDGRSQEPAVLQTLLDAMQTGQLEKWLDKLRILLPSGRGGQTGQPH